VGPFDISVAAYTEVHPEAPSPEFDLDNLKRKIDAGATRALTQFFFEPDVFLRFRDRCADGGIDVAIVPGILPIVNFARMLKFAETCGATVPGWLHERFANLHEDPQAQHAEAARTAIDQVGKLHRGGVDEFHFYTLNRAELVIAVCDSLGITPAPSAPEVADA
jgi:methylenetetrahydrofolate reductase (NADPH)